MAKKVRKVKVYCDKCKFSDPTTDYQCKKVLDTTVYSKYSGTKISGERIMILYENNKNGNCQYYKPKEDLWLIKIIKNLLKIK